MLCYYHHMTNNLAKLEKDLFQAFGTLKSDSEIKNFLIDLLTPAELEEFAKRFQIAKLLWHGDKSYLEIAADIKTSTTTVTRVARFLNKEPYKGYQTVLKRIAPKK